MQKVADAFRGDGAMAWGDHHPCLFSGTDWFFRTGREVFEKRALVRRGAR